MRADRWTSILFHTASAVFITAVLVLSSSFILGQNFSNTQAVLLYFAVAIYMEMRDRFRELNDRLKGAGFKLTDED